MNTNLNESTLEPKCVPAALEFGTAFAGGKVPLPHSPTGPCRRTVHDGALIGCGFNVMGDLGVREVFEVEEYRIWDGYVEASFSRTYASKMEKSPSHVIFLTAQVHSQKLAYLLLAERLGTPYAPGQKEYFKMWWQTAFCHIPKLIRNERGLVQKMWLRNLTKTSDRGYVVEVITCVNDCMWIYGSGPAFLI